MHFVDADVRDLYLAQMSEHGTYGDRSTLVAFASAFNVQIRVWDADGTHDTVFPSVAPDAGENSDRPITASGTDTMTASWTTTLLCSWAVHAGLTDRMRENGAWLDVHSYGQVLRIAAVRAFLRVHAQNVDRGGRGRVAQRVQRSFSDRINHGAWPE